MSKEWVAEHDRHYGLSEDRAMTPDLWQRVIDTEESLRDLLDALEQPNDRKLITAQRNAGRVLAAYDAAVDAAPRAATEPRDGFAEASAICSGFAFGNCGCTCHNPELRAALGAEPRA